MRKRVWLAFMIGVIWGRVYRVISWVSSLTCLPDTQNGSGAISASNSSKMASNKKLLPFFGKCFKILEFFRYFFSRNFLEFFFRIFIRFFCWIFWRMRVLSYGVSITEIKSLIFCDCHSKRGKFLAEILTAFETLDRANTAFENGSTISVRADEFDIKKDRLPKVIKINLKKYFINLFRWMKYDFTLKIVKSPAWNSETQKKSRKTSEFWTLLKNHSKRCQKSSLYSFSIHRETRASKYL